MQTNNQKTDKSSRVVPKPSEPSPTPEIENQADLEALDKNKNISDQNSSDSKSIKEMKQPEGPND